MLPVAKAEPSFTPTWHAGKFHCKKGSKEVQTEYIVKAVVLLALFLVLCDKVKLTGIIAPTTPIGSLRV